MMTLAIVAAIYIVSAVALYWIGTKLYDTLFAWPYALVAGVAAAWGTEFAAEIQLSQTFGVIPDHQPWPVISWGLIALASIAISGAARPSAIPIAIPCAIIAALALQHGIRLGEPASSWAGILTAFVGLACVILVPKLHREVSGVFGAPASRAQLVARVIVIFFGVAMAWGLARLAGLWAPSIEVHVFALIASIWIVTGIRGIVREIKFQRSRLDRAS